MNVQVIWQTGKLYYEKFKAYGANEHIQAHQFLNEMDMAYAAADLIISRAGAGSVSELCVVGKPVIFIPSPNVAEDHQTKNAESIAQNNAAIYLKESVLKEQFKNTFASLLKNEKRQQELSENIKKMAKPNATKDIVDAVENMIKL